MTILGRSLSNKIGFLLFGFLVVLLGAPTSYALPPDQSDDLQVTAEVPSDHQMVGATITSPLSGTVTNSSVISVRGNCEPDSTVVVKTNGVLAGSTHCSLNGTYELRIQLSPGRNELTARNFDSLGNAGPTTPSVVVTYNAPSDSPPVVTPPSLPDYPKTCRDYSPPPVTYGGRARMAVVCTPSFVEKDKTYELGLLIWGGEPPYAINVDWKGPTISKSLYSFTDGGYHTLPFSYKEPGRYAVSITLSDKAGYEAFTQTTLVVAGEAGVPEETKEPSAINTSWFYDNIPLYLVFITLVLGFWLGYWLGRRIQHKAKAIAKKTSL